MVSPVVNENGTEGVKASSFPQGDYVLIGWDIDTTGRRLIDEICQIAAYTPSDSFSQYVMPFRDINPAARRRHNIRVITIGRFRMLKDSKTGKVLKTKSEISALTDFVQWLETVQGKKRDGVILVSHEPRKVAAPLLLEALRKYNMLEKFCSIVKGFANSYSVAEVKCAKTVRSFSLRTLSRVLLDKEQELDNATDRARLAFQIVQYLCGPEDRQGSGDAGELAGLGLVQALSEFSHTIHEEELELLGLKTVLERQNSLRPVFGPMMQQERQRAMVLRKLLAEAGINYDVLCGAHQKNGNDGLDELIKSKLPRAKPKEVDDLQGLLHGHFNPELKSSSESKPQKNKASNKTGGGDASGSTTPDTATSSPVKVPKSPDSTTNSPPSKDNDASPQKLSNPVEPETTTPITSSASIPT